MSPVTLIYYYRLYVIITHVQLTHQLNWLVDEKNHRPSIFFPGLNVHIGYDFDI